MTVKICKRCLSAKPITEFGKNVRYRDGYTSWCYQCHRDRNSSWAKENRARLTKKSAVWRLENIESARAADKRFKASNRDELAAQHAAWAKANRDKRNATSAKRKAAKLRATPSWANQERIKAIYRRAVEIQLDTGRRMHVDHIIPLQHPLVCGLHCEANLQILPGPENESKRNKFEPFIQAALDAPDMFVEPPKPAKQEALEL